jgi:hypothetical protein
VNGGQENLSQQTSIDRTFLLGQIYLVLPANDRAPFQDSLCTGTQLWSTPTGSIPEHLQQAAGRDTPIPVLSGEAGARVAAPGGVNFLIVAMIVVGLAYVFVLVSRRARSSKPRQRSEFGRTSQTLSLLTLRRRRKAR